MGDDFCKPCSRKARSLLTERDRLHETAIRVLEILGNGGWTREERDAIDCLREGLGWPDRHSLPPDAVVWTENGKDEDDGR